jgi:hypothetical protein
MNHNVWSVALLSVAVVGVSLGAYYFLQKLQDGEEGSDDVMENPKELPKLKAQQSRLQAGALISEEAVQADAPVSDEEQQKLVEIMKKVESEFLLTIPAIEGTIDALEKAMKQNAQYNDRHALVPFCYKLLTMH